MKARILIQPTLTDNLTYIIHREGSQMALVIDPAEAPPVLRRLKSEGLQIAAILNTHHHHDHIGGNEDLIQAYPGAQILCSAVDLSRIPHATHGLHDREHFTIDELKFEALLIPGHTQGQMAFHFADLQAVFVGDTLFALGCGRLFEGSAAEMWTSLQRILNLPPATRLYFGHEYTERNAAFALSILQSHHDIEERLQRTRDELKSTGIATPPTLEEETRINPFLQPLKVRGTLMPESADALACFTELRRLRDRF